MSSTNEWPMVKLGKVVEINPKLPTRPTDEDDITFVPMTAVEEAGFIRSKALRSYGEVKKGYTPFLKGDLLLAKITPCFQNKKITAADIDTEVGIGSTEFHVLRTSGVIDMRYLLHFLRQDFIVSEGEKCMTGSGGQRRIPKWFLENLSIPLPPLAEQQRIAEILDISQQIKQNLHHIIQGYSSLATQVVEAAVDKSESNAALESLASINGGLALSKRRAELPLPVPYLRVANVFRNKIDLTEIKKMGCTPEEVERTELRVGDILMTEAHGNRTEIGRVAMVDQPLENFSYQNHLFRIRGKGTLPPLVLSHLINSRTVRQQLVQLATTTSGLKTISISKARQLQIPLLGAQEASDLNDQLGKIRFLSEKTQKKLTEAEELHISLSTRTFTGQL